MWVIRLKPVVTSKLENVYVYQVGYWIEFNGLMQFEIFDTSEEKLVAMRLCHYLNGGNQ